MAEIKTDEKNSSSWHGNEADGGALDIAAAALQAVRLT